MATPKKLSSYEMLVFADNKSLRMRIMKRNRNTLGGDENFRKHRDK